MGGEKGVVMEYCNVIVIKDSVVDEAVLVLGKSSRDVARKAEAVFLRKCAEMITDWGKYTPENRDSVLAEGYVKLGLFGSICISWPGLKPLGAGAVRGNAAGAHTGVAEIDGLPAERAYRILAEIYHFLFDKGRRWDVAKPIPRLEILQFLCRLMPCPKSGSASFAAGPHPRGLGGKRSRRSSPTHFGAE
jgi:hypothetical protein